MEITGLSAIVAGNASGLAGATARMLAARGAHVTIFDLDAEEGRKIAAEIGGHFMTVDIADDASVAAAFEDAEERYGLARILVSCVGIAPPARTIGKDRLPYAFDLFRKGIDINSVGIFDPLSRFTARLIAAEPVGGERGIIINTAALAGYHGRIGQTTYASSKAGVVGLTLCAARGLAEHRIRVVTISHGAFMAPTTTDVPQAARQSQGKQAPQAVRLGRPEQYAKLVEDVIGNPMLNGDVIGLDGATVLPGIGIAASADVRWPAA